MAGRTGKGPVHETVRQLVGSWWPKASSGSSSWKPRPSTPPVRDLQHLREAAKARMAVSRSYHARSGTTYDPTTGSVSGSGRTIGGKNTGRLYPTARPKPPTRRKKATARKRRR